MHGRARVPMHNVEAGLFLGPREGSRVRLELVAPPLLIVPAGKCREELVKLVGSVNTAGREYAGARRAPTDSREHRRADRTSASGSTD